MSRDDIVKTFEGKAGVIDTDKGRIVVRFYPEDAPNTVHNFASLAEQGFYDGLLFHRVIKGFMIQGGCPEGTGTGGPGWTVGAEFNQRKHEPGVLSMARARDPNSAGSQFFICLEKNTHLDGQYTAFGEVVKGMDVVRAIGDVSTGSGDRPVQDVKMLKIRIMPAAEAEKLDQ